jgi:phage host-nuclease inhibitor protein Gam
MDVTALIETAERLGPTPLPEGIAEYEDAANPEVRGAWAIETVQSADWALLRKGECEAEIADIDAMEKAAISEIRQRAARLRERAERGVRFFEFKLVEWMEKNRATIVHGKKKSRPLLHGTVGWRAKPERLEVVHPDMLMAWLAAQPVESGLYRVTLEPEMRAIQERFKTSGEIPPGCEIRPERDEPYTKCEAPTTALAR